MFSSSSKKIKSHGRLGRVALADREPEQVGETAVDRARNRGGTPHVEERGHGRSRVEPTGRVLEAQGLALVAAAAIETVLREPGTRSSIPGRPRSVT